MFSQLQHFPRCAFIPTGPLGLPLATNKRCYLYSRVLISITQVAAALNGEYTTLYMPVGRAG